MFEYGIYAVVLGILIYKSRGLGRQKYRWVPLLPLALGIGYFILYDFLKDYGSCSYISRFAVEEKYRKTGLGIDLITKAIDLARGKGTDLILLHSAASNENMVDFYGKRGFDLIDSENSRGYMRGLFANRSDSL